MGKCMLRQQQPATLLLGSSPRVAVPVARCLSGRQIPVYSATFTGDDGPIRSKAFAGSVLLSDPNYSLEGFFENLIAAMERYGIDTVLPVGGDFALGPLIAGDEMMPEGVFRLYPTPHQARQVLDKSATFAVAESLGIPVPLTSYVSTEEDLDSQSEALSFPVAVKPSDRGRAGPARLRYFAELEPLREFIRANRVWGIEWIVQEYVPGVGVGVEVLMDRGKAVAVFQHRRLKELPLGGGESVRCVSEKVDPTLEGYALNLLRALNWHGLAMVEFRCDLDSGRVFLMEVNGRCWGSIALPIQCGMEFPYYAWQVAHGEKPQPPEHYPLGQRMRWLGGDIRRLLELASDVVSGQVSAARAARDIGSFGGDFVNSTRDALWSRSDMRPFWRDVAEATREVAHRVGLRAIKTFSPRKTQ